METQVIQCKWRTICLLPNLGWCSIKNKIEHKAGDRYGQWTVLHDGEKFLLDKIECKCDCGVVKMVTFNNLGKTSNSCGHGRGKYNKTHGMTGSPEFTSWQSMRARVYKEYHPSYNNYGGRGIQISPEWSSFEKFYADMGPRSQGHSLERLDNDGNYEATNCIWSSAKEQNRNKRNVKLTKETAKQIRESNLSASELANLYNINITYVYDVKANKTWSD